MTQTDSHPTPFTADQIRDATQAGRTYRFRIETEGVDAIEHVMTFRAPSAEGAELAIRVLDASGKERSSPPPRRVLWHELRDHARFPRDRVTTREESITVPAGTYECVVYVVRGEDDETNTFCFAKSLPGAPILFFTETAGRRTQTSTLVAYIPSK